WYVSRDFYKKFDAQFPDKIASYYEKARDNHLFLSVVQRDPQINRSTESMLNANDLGLLRVTKETSDGIYLSGAKMIVTASPYSNDLLIYPLTKLTDAQKDLAHFLIVAANSPGLHMVCREPYANT